MSKAGDRLKAGVIEALAFANGDEPAASITINGHRYVSEATLASWGAIEVMTRNPAVSELISYLEARLDASEQQANYYGEVLALIAPASVQPTTENMLKDVRNDALEEAAMACLARGKVNVSSYGQYSNAATAIRALKTT